MKWIACVDRLPELRFTEDGSMEESDYVLTLAYPALSPAKRRAANLSYSDDGPATDYVVLQLFKTDEMGWHSEAGDIYWDLDAVTYWMPLPALPASDSMAS